MDGSILMDNIDRPLQTYWKPTTRSWFSVWSTAKKYFVSEDFDNSKPSLEVASSGVTFLATQIVNEQSGEKT